MNSQELPRLLTITEVSQILRISVTSTYRLIADKKLPCIRLSKRRMAVLETDLIAFVNLRRATEPGQLVFRLDQILEEPGR